MAPFRSFSARTRWSALAALIAIAVGLYLAHQHGHARFLPEDTTPFVALLPPPPAPDSAQTRRELDELVAIQRNRNDSTTEAARADRRKDVERFYGALGIPGEDPARVAGLASLMNSVEDDVSRYTRAAKKRFSRSRPYVLEPALQPCIGGVDDDTSYPSGHATYGYTIGYLLADMVPERRAELLERAARFAQARAVCGVHFPSDLEAGRLSGEWLAEQFLRSESYRNAALPVRAALRAALKLPA